MYLAKKSNSTGFLFHSCRSPPESGGFLQEWEGHYKVLLDWFVKAQEHLTCPDLGPAFDSIILKYIAFEKIAEFLPEPHNASFGSKNRPSQVAWWVGCGCKATPKITNIPAFEKQWCCGGKACNPHGAKLQLLRGPWLWRTGQWLMVRVGGWIWSAVARTPSTWSSPLYDGGVLL